MKKYRVSRIQFRTRLFLLVFLTAFQVCVFYAIFFDNTFIDLFKNEIVLLIACSAFEIFEIYTLIMLVYRFFTEYVVGEFSMDDAGITMYSLTRTLHYSWDECVEFGFTTSIASGVYGKVCAYNYYVYCSRHRLSKAERVGMFHEEKIRLRYDRHVFFQYRKDLFDEFLSYIPPEWQQRLRDEESRVNMNWLERLYNK